MKARDRMRDFNNGVIFVRDYGEITRLRQDVI
jgi:hypothetical protein